VASAPPAEGRRIGIIGKGGSGKSTTLGHLLAHWAAEGVPAAGMDTDDPGEQEYGSLYAWSDVADLGAPVYRAPAASRIAAEAKRLTPPGGILGIDTGAWERKSGNAHFAVLTASHLAVLALQPTTMEIERAGSVLKAIEQLEAVGAASPRLVILLTMVRSSASSARETRADLQAAGFTVLRTEIPRRDGRDGYAQAFGQPPRVVPGSPMAALAAELLQEATK
jgi:CobQ/CobB/MinD/ParA nucleotide binding domain